MKKNLLQLVLLLLIVQVQITHAQVTLGPSPYTQDFNAIGTALPAGWTVRFSASSTTLGTVATPVLTPNSASGASSTNWNSTSGNFRNSASATGQTATTTAALQASATNRSIGVRQTGSLGDPGAAFVLQLNNTLGLSNFSLSFLLQQLDGTSAAGRTTTWIVDYGVGSAPTTFTPVTTTPATLTTTLPTFASTNVTVNFGTALDNISGNVWIRIVTLAATSGSGSRPTTAIDDFQLSYTAGDVTPPAFTSSFPKVSNYSTTGFDLHTSLNEQGNTYYVVLPDGALAPSSAQVKAGQDASGTTAGPGYYGTIAVSAPATDYFSTLSLLTQNTQFDVYLAAEDNLLNLQSSPVKLDVKTNQVGDVTPPAFTANYPKIDLISSTGFTLRTNLDDQGRTYFVILAGGSPAPTSVQVKNKHDASDASLAANLTGTIDVPLSATEYTAAVTALTSDTPYDVYIISEDNALNISATPSKISITTGKQFIENFDDCDGTASFSSFSVTGDQVWGCTDFGRGSTKGIRMNGFLSTAVVNEDWLISPVVNLTGNPSMSFYSQFSFAGNGLLLKISTDYSGTGAPSAANWTDLNGNFPTVAVGSTSTALSDWTFSSVDLSAYANQKVYVAFVYTSTASAAARWTLDEVTFNNAAASYLKVTPSGLSFNASGLSKSYTLKGFNLVNGVTVTAPANFLVSKDNTTFSNTISYTAVEANAQQTVNVKFSVTGVTTDTFQGAVVNASTGVSPKNVQLKGADLTQTFDITAYNLEFFGTDVKDTGGTEFGPTDDALQVSNVTAVLKNMGSDIFGVEEIADDNAFNQLVTNLPGYDKIVSPKWSYSFDPPDPNFPPQKIGFIYNTSTVKVVSSRVMFSKMYDDIQAGTVILPSYPGGTSSSFWSSGRLPFMVTFDVTIAGSTRRIRIIDIHSKSGSAQADYDRRKYDVQVLHDSLNAKYPTDRIILLGDYNDDVDNSILPGAVSSYKSFVDDVTNYNTLTSALSATAGVSTFPSSSSFIDHIIVSNEMTKYYVANSVNVEDARNYIPNYLNTTSDHLPITARFLLSVKEDQTVTFDPIADKTVGNPAFTLTATATSTLPITFTTTSDKITISGNQATIVKAGRATITANQVGNTEFNVATANQSFCIKPAKPAVVLSNPNSETPTLTSSSATGNQWYLGGTAIAGATSSTLNVTTPGVYKVQVKADDCVSEFSADVPIVVTGDLTQAVSVSIYPNPVEDKLYVHGITNPIQASHLYNMAGQSTDVQLKNQEGDHLVEVGTLSAGIYVLRIQEGTSIHQIKFVKK